MGLDPMQRLHRVKQTIISRSFSGGCLTQHGRSQKAPWSQPIIDRHDNHTGLCQRRTIEDGMMTPPTGVRATVQPHHHGSRLINFFFCPHG